MQVFNKEKFSEAVHYICSKSDVDKLGAIKLNKILWFSDTLNFLVEGESITGEDYIKRQFGPVPKHILTVLEELEITGKLCINDKTLYGLTKKEYLSIEQPKLNLLLSHEISIIDDMIDRIGDGHTAHSISELTHDEIWEMADIGEVIPYETVLVATLGEIDETDIEWVNDILAKKAA
jgi:hypothetical protein